MKSGDQFFRHKFDDVEELSKRFDAAERDEWQMTEEAIDSFDLTDDATVAEVGAGSGYFTVRLAERLRRGKVIGLDKEPEMVAYLKNRAEKLGLTNVDARLAKTGAEVDLEEKVDLILCVDTYHHMPNTVSYFSSFIEHLKTGGRLVIIDRKTSSPEGPPSEHGTPPELVKKEMEEAGFKPVKDLDFLPYQFYIVFGLGGAGDAL